MSRFSQDLQARFMTASFESATVMDDLPLPPPTAESATPEDVLKIREERNEVAEIGERIDQLQDDVRYLGTVDKVSQVVCAAADAAKHVEPAVAEAFVGAANLAIDDASKLIGVEIPTLANTDDGSVDTVSLECLDQWIEQSAGAFAMASEDFFTRIKGGWVEIQEHAAGFAARLQKIKTLLPTHESSGEALVMLGSHIACKLVKGNGYSPNYAQDLSELMDFSYKFSALVSQYLDAFCKANGALAGHPDLDKLADELEHQQPAMMLGNLRYDEKEIDDGRPKVLSFIPEIQEPHPKQLVRVLDSLKSQDRAFLESLLEQVAPLVDLHAQKVAELVNECEQGRQCALRAFGERAEESSHVVSQKSVMSQLGLINLRQMHYASEVSEAINAVLSLAEESVFQDSQREINQA